MALGNLTVKEPEYGSGSRAIPLTSPSDTKYIRITDFSDDGIPPNHEFVTAEVVEDKYNLEDGDILFARSGATAGKTFIYTADIGEAIFAGYCIRFQFDRMKVMPEFVYFYTKIQRYQAWVNSIQRPSGQPNINKEEFKSFTIPLPPLEIQQSLVAEIQAARQTRKQRVAQADELFTSTDTHFTKQLDIKIPIKSSTSDVQHFAVKRRKVGIRLDPFYNLPEHQVLEAALSDCPYKVLAIADKKVVREIVEGRITPKTELYSEDPKNPIFLRAQNIEKGYLNFSDAKRLKREAFEAEPKAILRDGDIVLTIDGALLGIAAVHRSGDEDCCISNHMVRIQHGIEIDPEYLAWFLNSSAGQKQIKRGITGSAIPGIRTDALERILVPVPPLDIQRSLVIEIEQRRADAQRLRQEAEAEWEAAKTRFEHKLLGEEL